MNKDSNLRKIVKYITFMKITERVASLSYDPKYQVGSIIIDKHFSNICAIGYNGNYPGGPNERESLESGHSGFLHAEENAVIQGNIIDPENHILFVTMTPCKMCAKRIARKGIKEVIALNYYEDNSIESCQTIFNHANIEFNYLNSKIRELFNNTNLYVDLIGLMDELKFTTQNSEESIFKLQKLLFTHLDTFFEFNKDYMSKIPFETIIFDINNIEESYINTFYKIVYSII